MTREEKELLLKDLCGRLPYGVKLKYIPTNEIITLEFIGKSTIDGDIHDLIENFSVCLFPLSSMTEEQRKELQELYFDYISDEILNNIEYVYHYDCMHLIDWLNKNHFDYRGLIPMGLANDATGLNIY